jgi:hypothetical protein
MIDLDEVKEVNIDGTVFVIKRVAGKDAMIVQELLEDKELNTTDKSKSIIIVALKEIKNIIIDGEVKIIIEITKELVEKFYSNLLTKLLKEIIDYNFPKEEEKKN